MANPNLTYAFDNDILIASNFSRAPDGNIYYSNDNHSYILPNKGIEPRGYQSLTFIHGIPNDPEPGSPLKYVSGVSDEQLLEVLINRSEYFQRILPCEENVVALSHLKAALQAKLDRTAKRQAQNVEGTTLPH